MMILGIPKLSLSIFGLQPFILMKVKEIVTKNRHLTLREIAAELSVSHIFIRTILRGSSGSPSDFHTHFQEFIASKPQKIMT